MADVRLAFDADTYLGETPAWSVAEQALWWVNCEQPPELNRWHPQSGAHRAWPMPRRIGGFAFKADGAMLVALADGVYDFAPGRGDLTLRAPSPFASHVNLHESCVDRQGRFWIGGYDSRYPEQSGAADAGYCRLDGERLVIEVTGVHIANGLAFSPDGRTMYAATSPPTRIDAFDLNPVSGSLSNRRAFVTLPDGAGYPDGAAVDSEGGYWLANATAGELRRYLPDGTLDRAVPLPCSNPTKPAFGGPDLKTLYVTTTRIEAVPVARSSGRNGPIYALEPGETGIVEALVAG